VLSPTSLCIYNQQFIAKRIPSWRPCWCYHQQVYVFIINNL
jgi:hypothetical protein